MADRTYNYEAHLSRYEARVAAGLCPIHPRRKAAKDRRVCEGCVESNRERQAVRYERRKKKGLCTGCKAKAADGRRVCEDCRRRGK